MLDPSLPWLAVGYRNFKQEEFCQKQIRDEVSKYRTDTTDVSGVLRSSTPQGHQRRRVKSATAARFTSCSCDSFLRPTPTRPKSAQLYNHRGAFVDQNVERSPAARQRRPRSAFLPHHRPSPAQNRSVSAVERQHHLETTIKLYVDERDSRCAFCPVECRPKSSSTNRPTSSTGLVAAHVPTHYDRYVFWTRPRTAPATRREFLQLPRRNNIRRGNIPHYTNFVKRVELGLRDGTPSPPLRRRRAFEEEPTKRHSPSLESSSNADDEDDRVLVHSEPEDEEEEIDDEVEEDVSICIPTPTEPLLDEEKDGEPDEPPTDDGQDAWTQPKAPTPSPAISGRNSPEAVLPEILPAEAEHGEPEEQEKSPLPREPTPPPRESSPAPREPSPPPRVPTPPPREPTPPTREPTPPPRQPTPPPREPTPPPPPEPKAKKEVRIQETPIPAPAKPKSVPQVIEKKTKSCLAKKPEVPKEKEPQTKPPPADPAPKEPVEVPIQTEEKLPEISPTAAEDETTEDVPAAQEDTQDVPEDTPPNQTSNSKEPVDDTEQKPDKKKLGPPPKYKVDLFAVDSQAMKDLLDMEMKMRRKGPGSHVSDTDSAPPDIPEHLLKRKQPWQQGRLALSRRASRFEIPMDVHLLETMTPTEYLQKYCIVSKRRQAMYRRSFNKADKDNDMKINMKEFNAAVLEALVDTVQVEQVQDVLKLIEADGFTHFGPKLFCAICSLLERLYYRDFVTEDTVDQENLVAKEKVEDADFLALDWKFDGCAINPPLKRLLYML